jgi:uncharacterized protein (TIGR02996 family)
VVSVDDRAFLQALEANEEDVTSRLAYADWLDEQGRWHEALLQRVEAGVSEVRYQIRRKSDGLFSEGGGRRVRWSARGKLWPQLASIKGHLVYHQDRPTYANTPWDDVEIVVFEIRLQPLGSLPLSREDREGPYRKRKVIVLDETPGRQAPPGSA